MELCLNVNEMSLNGIYRRRLRQVSCASGNTLHCPLRAQVYLIQQAGGASYESFRGAKSCCGALCGEQEQAVVNMDASPLHALEESIKYYSDLFARPSRIEVWQQHLLQIKCGCVQEQPI